MSELIRMALRLLIWQRRRPQELPKLPAFKSGGVLVDVSDRDALYEAMEGR